MITICTTKSAQDFAAPIIKKIKLSQEVATTILETTQFADGEIKVTVPKTVRKHDVYVITQLQKNGSLHSSLMELFLACDALSRSGVSSIAVIIPYLPYSRQEKKKEREPIAASLLAKMLKISGVDHLLTVDVHADQIAGFYDINFDNLRASPVLEKEIESLLTPDTILVSPDVGGANRVRYYANVLETDMAMMNKTRDYSKANTVERIDIIGDVKNKDVILIDDMIDTAGTICKAVEELHAKGAKSIRIVCTHAVLSGPAMHRLEELYNNNLFAELICTNTISVESTSWIKVVIVQDLCAQAIEQLIKGESLHRQV
jgi:ribose-phosphate pyrophosphokinase